MTRSTLVLEELTVDTFETTTPDPVVSMQIGSNNMQCLSPFCAQTMDRACPLYVL